MEWGVSTMSRFLYAFIALLLFAVASSSLANESDDKRVYFHYMKGVLHGEGQFANAIHEFRKRYDEIQKSKANPSPSMATIGGVTDSIIEAIPKSGDSSTADTVYQDFKTVAQHKSKTAKNVLKRLDLYMIPLKYLTSGPMKAPRHYEQLANISVDQLQTLRDNITYFVSKSNAGLLTFEESEAVSRLFSYYTGSPLGLPDAQMANDPLMTPFSVVEDFSADIQKGITEEVAELKKVQKARFDEISTILADRAANESLAKFGGELSSLQTFDQVDEFKTEVGNVSCSSSDASCDKNKQSLIKLAENQKERIALSERTLAIDSTIQLGQAISAATGNKELGKAFSALDTVNRTVKDVDHAINTFNSASTTLGSVASVAMASTSVVGAAVALSALAGGGQSDSAEVLAALAELKEMVQQLTDEVRAGFERMDVKLADIETLIRAYGNIASMNQSAISTQISDVASQIYASAQPVSSTEVDYRLKASSQIEKLRVAYHSIVLSPTTKSTTEKHAQLREMIASLFTIIDFTKSGEYRLGNSAQSLESNYSGLLEASAKYSDDEYRRAFLLQAILNTSDSAACGKVNLIGYQVVSSASTEIVNVISTFTQKELANFITSGTNKDEFAKSLEKANSYLVDQSQAILQCVSGSQTTDGILLELSKRYNAELRGYLGQQLNLFFENGSRLNDVLLIPSAEAKNRAPGGFKVDQFSLGHLVANSRSFALEKWDRVAPGPPVIPHETTGGSAFVLEKKYFSELMSDANLRLAHLAGAGIEYRFVSKLQFKDRMYVWIQPGEVNFSIFLLVPAQQKLAHIWRWTIPTKDFAEFMEEKSVPNINPQLRTKIRIASGQAKALYDRVSASEKFMHYLQFKDRKYWTCNVVDSLLDCRHKSSAQFRPTACPQFRSEFYFNGALLGDQWQCGADEDSFFNNSVENPSRKEVVEALSQYVVDMHRWVGNILSPCLREVVLNGKCRVEGQEVIFNDAATGSRFVNNAYVMLAVAELYIQRASTELPVGSMTQGLPSLNDLSRGLSSVDLADGDATSQFIENFASAPLDIKIDNDWMRDAAGDLAKNAFFDLRSRLLPLL
jgi:hypothetical protein